MSHKTRRRCRLVGILAAGIVSAGTVAWADGGKPSDDFAFDVPKPGDRVGIGNPEKETVVLDGSHGMPGTVVPTQSGQPDATATNLCAMGRVAQADAQLSAAFRNEQDAHDGRNLDSEWAAWGCADGSWEVGLVPTGSGPAAPALPSPSQLAIQASTSVTLTTPAVNINPYWLRPDGRNATLKNAETWFWVDQASWVTHTPRVDAGPVWVEATITPTSIVITPNDGVTGTKTCKGKGTALPQNPPPLSEPSPTCSVRFLNQTDGDIWPMTVHVVYEVTWTGFDGTNPVSGTLADISTVPVTYPIAVLTAKPVLVDPNGPPATAAPNHGD